MVSLRMSESVDSFRHPSTGGSGRFAIRFWTEVNMKKRLSKSLRKYIRQEKARIRRGFFSQPEKVKKEIEELNKKFRNGQVRQRKQM